MNIRTDQVSFFTEKAKIRYVIQIQHFYINYYSLERKQTDFLGIPPRIGRRIGQNKRREHSLIHIPERKDKEESEMFEGY